MSRMAIKPTQDEQMNLLSAKIDSYKDGKDKENALNKSNKTLNEEIKSLMSQLGTNEFSSSLYTATVTTTYKETFDDEKALEILKDNLTPEQISAVVKVKEYIDEEALEKLVYNGEFDISNLACCKSKGPAVNTLRISKVKK